MRFVRHGLSALAGVCVASFVLFAASSVGGGDDIPRTDRRPPTTDPVEVDSRSRRTTNRLLLAWVPTGTGGLPPNSQDILQDVRGVRSATIASASLDWMSAATSTGGTRLDSSIRDMAIPVEVVAIDPDEYAVLAPPSDRPALEGLQHGEVLLSETSAELRGDPTAVTLGSGRYRVAGVVSDAAANGYEMVVRTPPPVSWDIVDRFALIHASSDSVRKRVRRALVASLRGGQVLRLRAKGETPYLRYGDAVMPQAIIKQSFGEFAARPLSDGTLAIDDRWVQRNIARAPVPILGEVVCHRALFPQLRAALREVRRRGLSFLIDTSQYGGCYGPRFIGRVPGGRLSHHAWGIAIDVNAADNAFGTRSDLDPRLVEIMERFGFTWGGRWLIPDGMHFEWVRFP